jgi:hypothetical protein
MIWAHRLGIGLSATEYRVLMVLCEHAHHDGSQSWPSVKTIASEAEMSSRSVQAALRTLRQRGVIEIERVANRHSPAVYRMNMHLFPVRASSRGAEKPDVGRKKSPSGAQINAFRGAEFADEPVHQPVKEPLQGSVPHSRPQHALEKPSPEKKKRAPIPPNWEPDVADVEFALKMGVGFGVLALTDQFRDYYLSRGTRIADWSAAWRNWCRREAEFAARRGGSAVADPDDKWGLKGWVAKQQPSDGLFDPKGWEFDALEEILLMTGLPPSWRGNLDLLGDWIREGYRPDSVAAVIAEMAGSMSSAPRSLAAFSHQVRSKALWYDPRRHEWVRRWRG